MINNSTLNPNGKNIQMVLFYDENNEKTERIIKEWNLFETDCAADINVVKIKLSENIFSNYDVCVATDEHYPSILVLDKTNVEIVDLLLMAWARVEDELSVTSIKVDDFTKIREKWGQILTELLDEQEQLLN